MKKELMSYIDSVYYDELRKMDGGLVTLHAGGPLHSLMDVFYRIDAASFSNKELYAETLKRLNSLAQDRRLRIFAGNDTVPEAIWFVLLVGGVFTVFLHVFLRNEKHQSAIRHHYDADGDDQLILFLIYVLDHPFTGTSKVSVEPLKQVMATMHQDKHSRLRRFGTRLTPLFLRAVSLFAWSSPFCAARLCSSICTFLAKLP